MNVISPNIIRHTEKGECYHSSPKCIGLTLATNRLEKRACKTCKVHEEATFAQITSGLENERQRKQCSVKWPEKGLKVLRVLGVLECWGEGVSQQRTSQTGGERRRAEGIFESLIAGRANTRQNIKTQGAQMCVCVGVCVCLEVCECGSFGSFSSSKFANVGSRHLPYDLPVSQHEQALWRMVFIITMTLAALLVDFNTKATLLVYFITKHK